MATKVPMAVFIVVVTLMTAFVHSEIVNIPKDVQKARHHKAQMSCLYRIATEPPYPTDAPHCNRTWDGVACWPDTPAGTVGTQSCMDYIIKFDTEKNATRICLPTGEWFFNDELNKTWTDFSDCYNHTDQSHRSIDPPMHIVENIGNIVLIYNVGYGVSLFFLVIAVFIMIYFRKLHCKRNTIHVNLFVSFILRCAISFMKENLLVQGLGLPQDVYTDESDKLRFKTEGTHWECKLLFTVFHYVLGANYMWVFVEGLYLYTLLFVAVFSEKRAFKWYILFGWASPLAFVLPWVLVRIYLENEYCWNMHHTPGYFWIMKGPIVLSILINFIFFLLIVRALFTKLQSSSRREGRDFRYRRLAKSTLVLIPLFGAYYIIFICIPAYSNPQLELVMLYAECIMSSFQGFIVALLFCFLNGEVQSELRKKWGCRSMARRGSSARSGTMSTIARGSTMMSMSLNDDGLQSSRLYPARFADAVDDSRPLDSMEMMPDITRADSNGHAHKNYKDKENRDAHAPNGHVGFFCDGDEAHEEGKPMLLLDATDSDKPNV